MSQPQGPTLINLPPSGAETPSEAPGTPTSTTTSLSSLSTTAIKDGHRGHHNLHALGRSHAHHPSTTSLEAERADRISRLAGLERIAALRAIPPPPPQQSHSRQHSVSSHPSSTNPPSSSSLVSGPPPPPAGHHFPLNYPDGTTLTPAYFNSHGQPVAAPTKMSTVGTASATESNGRGNDDDDDIDDARTTRDDDDDDLLSLPTDTASLAPMMMPGDDDIDGVGPRSVSGFEDRMSDDGSASLVGFGEGAGSTLSGPIYQRRPLSQLIPQYSSANGGSSPANWMLERQGSGLSDAAPAHRRDRDSYSSVGQVSETPPPPLPPASLSALQERRDARMIDGVAPDPVAGPGDDVYYDTTNRAPVFNTLLRQYQLQQLRERQHQAMRVMHADHHHQHHQSQQGSQQSSQSQGLPPGHQNYTQNYTQVPPLSSSPQPHQDLDLVPPYTSNTVRPAQPQSRMPLHQMHFQSDSAPGRDVESMVSPLDDGETRLGPGSAALGDPSRDGDRLGRFYFEDKGRG